jgi:hypothetical protein
MKSLRMKTASLLIGCLYVAVSVTSSALGQGTLDLYPTSITLGYQGDFFTGASYVFPTPTGTMNDYDYYQVHFNAPTGYAFRYTPDGVGAVVAEVIYGDTSGAQPSGIAWGNVICPGLQCTGGSGTVVVHGSYPNDVFSYNLNAVFTGNVSVEFTSCSIAWQPHHDHPIGFPISQFTSATLRTAGEPGEIGVLTLVPIPEPSLAALALLGAITVIGRSGLGTMKERKRSLLG